MTRLRICCSRAQGGAGARRCHLRPGDRAGSPGSSAGDPPRAGWRHYDAFVALGCVIRGETSHYDIVAGESARGLMDLAVQRGALIGNGILTTD